MLALDAENFKRILRSNFSPARAISDPSHLRGRKKLLNQIDWAFNSPGKHVFIYGERGVGKTSLARSAATIHQSSDAHPIIVAGDEFSNFYKTIADVARKALPPEEVIEAHERTHGARLSLFGLSGEMHKGFKKGVIPPIESLNDAIVVLKYVASFHSVSPVVIVDEFDQIKETDDRKRFADLIKQVSDQELNLKLIFCGIGRSLEELIGVHLSTDRYLAPVEVTPLTHDALWEILKGAANELGVEVGHEELVRISRISDGFPYYVHLVGEHMFRAMFDEEGEVHRVAMHHFDQGLRGAISEALSSLKRAYALAIQKRRDDYEEVLWAVADDKLLEPRPTAEVYVSSYLPIMERRNAVLLRQGKQSRDVLSQAQFYQRMNRLKGASHGHILTGSRAGWYSFTENWMRGYVRLRAEQAGVSLGIDLHHAPYPEHRVA